MIVNKLLLLYYNLQYQGSKFFVYDIKNIDKDSEQWKNLIKTLKVFNLGLRKYTFLFSHDALSILIGQNKQIGIYLYSLVPWTKNRY